MRWTLWPDFCTSNLNQATLRITFRNLRDVHIHSRLSFEEEKCFEILKAYSNLIFEFTKGCLISIVLEHPYHKTNSQRFFNFVWIHLKNARSLRKAKKHYLNSFIHRQTNYWPKNTLRKTLFFGHELWSSTNNGICQRDIFSEGEIDIWKVQTKRGSNKTYFKILGLTVLPCCFR